MVNANNYVAADQETVTNAKATALAAIEAATTEDEVAAALNAFNTAISGCTTKASQAAANLSAAKRNAKATVNGVNAADYVAADQETVTNAKTTALKAIDAATTRAAVTEALNAFNSAVSGCTTQAAADASAAVSGDVAPVGVTVEETMATVTDAGIDEALAATEADAVTVDASALKTEITEVVIPSAVLTKVAEAVADENNSADGLEIKLTEGTIRLNAEAVAAIKEQAGGRDLHVSLNRIQAEKLNQAQQDAIKDMEALAMYEASILVDGQRVEISGGSKVTAAVKVELAEGQSESGVRVFSVNEAGDRTEVPVTWENGEAKFSVDSFSKYIVTCDAAQ